MKGWHKHGVCARSEWPSRSNGSQGNLTNARARDAARRPLGAYYRVNHKDLIAMHAAITEVGVLYATASVHTGWDDVKRDGVIHDTHEIDGGHAFALVGYDENGFWLQNSWGKSWGRHGFGHISYDDWLANGTDVWVARLGVPVVLRTAQSTATTSSLAGVMSSGQVMSAADLRPHIISIGNDGQLRTDGTYGTSREEVESIILHDVPTTLQTLQWPRKRLLLYAHGGLVKEEGAIQRVADYRAKMLGEGIYPLAFIWKTDYWTTMSNMLKDANSRRRPEGVFDRMKDFLLDRADDFLEPIGRLLTGKAEWDEIKENGILATKDPTGGARLAADCLARLVREHPDIELHAAGHSAGGVFHAPFVQYLATSGAITAGPLMGQNGLGAKIATCSLWAPACSIALFSQTYLPLVKSGGIGKLAIYALTDKAEQDDNCANIYHKSLLYWVQRARGAPAHPAVRGRRALLGMQKFLDADRDVQALRRDGRLEIVYSPNLVPLGKPDASCCRRHGDFDDDEATVIATMARIRGAQRAGDTMTFHRSASGLRDRRLSLETES
jgi:hypothetical protein